MDQIFPTSGGPPSPTTAQGLVDAQNVEGMRSDADVKEILTSIGHHVPETGGGQGSLARSL